MIGLSPREVDDCTLWEFGHAVDGFRKANSPADDKAPAMSETDLRDMGIVGF